MNYPFNDIFVINRDQDTDRLQKIKDQLNNLNLSFTRFPAITKDFEKYSKNISGYCKLFCKPAHIGCAMSHITLWGNISKLNIDDEESFLILEDDAIFSDNFQSEFFKYYNQVPTDWNLIFLGLTSMTGDPKKYSVMDKFQYFMAKLSGLKSNVIVPNNRGEDIIRTFMVFGIHVYIIKKKTAKIFYDNITHKYGIDADIGHYLSKNDNIKAYSFAKDLVTQTNTIFSSVINRGKKPYIITKLLDERYFAPYHVSPAYLLHIAVGEVFGVDLSAFSLLLVALGFILNRYNFNLISILKVVSILIIIDELVFISSGFKPQIDDLKGYYSLIICIILGFLISEIVKRKLQNKNIK